jgi:CheY-like chemotaxis protein
VYEAWRPDLLICDLSMPDVDGYALLRRLRSLPSHQSPQVPAIALTALTGHEHRRRVLAAGFQACLGKPVAFATMVSTIAELRRGPLVPDSSTPEP